MIATLGQLEILKRLGRVPLDPLVDALRDLHASGTSDSKRLQELLAPSQVTHPVARPAVELRRAPHNVDYEAARKHFVEHAERLRKQTILAERLLERLQSRTNTSAPLLQQELEVECRRHAAALTQFVVANTLDRSVTIGFRVGRVHHVRERPEAGSFLTFDPPAPRLEPGDERVVTLSIDLSQYDAIADWLECGVDLLGDGELLAKLWLRVRIRE